MVIGIALIAVGIVFIIITPHAGLFEIFVIVAGAVVVASSFVGLFGSGFAFKVILYLNFIYLNNKF